MNAGHKEMTNRLVDGMFCLHLSQVAEWSLSAQSAIGMDWSSSRVTGRQIVQHGIFVF